jgi:hypothetical protein
MKNWDPGGLAGAQRRLVKQIAGLGGVQMEL